MKKDIVLKKGCSYTDAVKAVQEALNKTQQAGLEPDGNFGKKTEAAVKAFQEHCIKTWRRAGAADKLAGFQPDGVVGPKTLLALDAALLEVDASLSGKDGQGVEVEVAPSCKAPPAEGEEKAYEAFREAIRAVGIFKDAPWEMNILGIRGFKDGARVPAGSGDFSDTLALVYVCEKGHKHAPQWPACTDPAAGVDGKPDVHLHEGQYAYKMDQDGLSPRGAVKVWLDTAEDGVKRSDDPVVEGIYAARIVPNPGGTLSDLEGGLQVLQGNARSEAWKTFWSLLQSDPDQSYFYTLVDGSAIPGHDPKEQTKPAPAPAKHEDKASLPPPLAGTPPPIRAEGDPAPTDAPFASPTGLYWPVLTRLKQGRTVSYKNTAGKMVGIAGRRFLATRSEGKRYHVGIDLFGDYGDPVVACEDGKIVAWYHFYQGVYCLLVECKSGKVINYGELDKDSLLKCKLKVGDEVKAGQQIGIVGRMTSGSSMLHFETYASGTRSNQRWMAGEKRPAALLDPTRYLLALATATAPASEPAVCPDCPALRALVDAGTVSEKIKRKSADKEAVKALQRHLVRFGYDVGKVDGDYGDKTAAASNAFFRDAGVQDANHNVLSAEEARFIIKKCGEGWKKPVPPTEARLVVYPKGADPKSAGAELTAAPGAKLVLAWEIPNGDVRRIAIRMGGQTQDVTRVTQKANGAWRGALEIALTASDVDAATGKASAQLLIEPAAPGVDYGAAHITLAEPPPPMTIGKFEGAAGDQRGDVLRVPEYDTVELSWDQRGADAIEIYEDTGAGPRFLTSLAPPARSVTVRPIANQTDYTLVARLRDKSLQAKNSVHVTLIPAA